MRSVAAVVALVVCMHAGIWGLLQRHYAASDVDGQLASVSYSPYARAQHPDFGDRPTADQIRADLKILSSFTRSIPLPRDVKTDEIKATYVDGVLEVRVPAMVAAHKPVKVPVERKGS